VCERAVGPGRTCDFRSGRVILQRPIERAQMQKLLTSGKTDLLQFVSARTRRAFAAYLVRQHDGKIGFEFQPREGAKGAGARSARAAGALKVLGPHPKDKRPVELHAGRYGPYVKHGGVNATLSAKQTPESVTLREAVALLAAKAGRTRAAKPGKPAANRKSAARPTARKRAA
jgi:DNA topoisomerase-3